MFLSSEFNNHNLIIEDDHQLELINTTTPNIQEASTISSKSLNTYICDICDYKTNRKHNYTIHLSSDKHIKQLAIKNRTFTCDSCQYSTNNRFSYDKHVKTVKHKMNVVTSNSKKDYKYNCELCNFHTNKKCNYDKHITSKIHKTVEEKEKEKQNEILHNTNSDIKKSDNDNDDKNEYHKKLLNTAINNDTLDSIMSEIKTLMVEQNKMNQIITEMANKPVTNITNNNNNHNHTSNHQFNMNMFLNETCKDAMNMSEFIENLTVTMEDMEMTGTLGFAKGMSRIIMNNLNALEVHKRPIHCSDAKRETLYVKNNGVWEKDTDDKKHTKELIYKVSSLNLKHLLKWRELPRNKGYDNPEHKKNDEFTILVMEINKVKVEEIEKVVTIISKNVTIDKNKVRMSGYLN
jgi:hypothetical protein